MIVSDQYRKNPLSLKPGGSEVTFIFNKTISKTYDKIKHIKAFINKSVNDNPTITSVYVDGKLYKHN